MKQSIIAVKKNTPRIEYQALMEAGELKPDTDQINAINALERLHEKLTHYSPSGIRNRNWLSRLFSHADGTLVPPSGIYLFGGVGRGKSMLMDLFYETAPLSKKQRIHFQEFMLDIHARLKVWHGLSTQQRKLALKDIVLDRKIDLDDPIPAIAHQVASITTLLCFDELQITDIADAMVVTRLFQELFDQGVVVVSTSNRAPDELYKNGLNRHRFIPFIDRIKERMEIIPLNGPIDYRYDRLKGVETYFHPVNDATTMALSTLFFRLTDRNIEDRDKVPSGELIVQRRKLFVPKSARGVAVFSFKRLCANPLGAADYLAVAKAYHTVIMVAIPQFTYENASEATRFMHFIDALYEYNVKFLCSAAAPPQQLYRSGNIGFEFERVVSRLMEMQSNDYLIRGHGKLPPKSA